MKKQILSISLAAALAVSCTGIAMAEDKTPTVFVNQGQIFFDDQAPVILGEGTTLVPARGVFEAMGASVDWNEESGDIIVSGEDITITMSMGSSIMKAGENTIELDTPPELMSDRAMLPVRAICEVLGAVVEWDSENTTVNINTSIASLLPSEIDNTKWSYNAEDDVYWQVGISYCSDPADEKYETLGIFVPGAYMSGQDNGDGTYTCEINTAGTVGGYTAETAPMVMPINTPGYSAMNAPTDYVSGVSPYTDAGFIYVNAGCRGRDAGAPAGVTDLKAAVRYIRYISESIPGNTDSFFTFGMSGGGAQSALMGATGNSELYTPYLEAIGAVEGESDAVTGSMCWCPITSLDYANEAYEWNLGLSRTDLDEETQALSDGMSKAFVEYLNALGLKDENGNVLSLEQSENGLYMAGSYYDYLKDVIETSLNNFLNDTEFPYTPASQRGGMMGGGMHGGMMGDNAQRIEDIDGIARNETDSEPEEDVTYATVQEYIDSLNNDTEWVIYDSATNTAEITSVEDFVKACKNASKSVGAFDDLNCAQGENMLFGYGDGAGAHFDSVMAELLQGTEYGESYAEDMGKTDFLGNSVQYRVNMYNPMYYLEDYYDGYKTSDVAKYWRIRTGINQGDTALTTEVNLALALENYGIEDVDFETVWGQAHVEAERTGSSTENFISWVNECLSAE